MCGILGEIATNCTPCSMPELRFLQHRGPDGQGEWRNKQGNVYFGHTRLAILEPTPAGRQPMSDASGRFTITFNGEIYNHLQLRKLLPEVRWRGSSDTETLVELIAVKGVHALHFLKGMFAFALYDSAENSVLLARDRLGIKPLWMCITDKVVRFSSEIRVLMQKQMPVLKKTALSEYIAFGRMPNRGEIIEGITAVPAGSWVKIRPGYALQTGAWWPNDHLPFTKVASRQQSVQRVRHWVTTAVEEHLLSDVGVGAFLSGGIDSSIVTMVAGKVLGKKLQTFTVGFPQSTLDERMVARKVAKQAGSLHTEIEVSEQDCLAWVKDAVACLDLPSVDAINTFIVSRAVRQSGLKVALSGLGGDELFGGYPSFKNVPLLAWLGALPTGVSRRLISFMPERVKEKLSGLKRYAATDLAIARRRFTAVARLTQMGLNDGAPVVPLPPRGLDRMGQISWAEMQGYMIPMLLRDSDQMSMAVGLEVRVPFLDHQLVEDVLHLKQEFKKGGVKSLLVEAFRKDLPSDVYDRPKQGFVLPMQDWLHGPLVHFVQEGVQAAADRLQVQEPIRLWGCFKNNTLHWTRVWSWCVLGYWLQKHQVAVEALPADKSPF